MKSKKQTSKKESKCNDITLLGYKIKIYKNKVVIDNKDKLPFEEFRPIADKLVQYMMDELFITQDKIDVEVIIPKD